MKQILTVIILLAGMISFGCEQKNTTVANTTTANTTNSGNMANKNAELPKTEKIDGDYVESEAGTEKSKPADGTANVQGKVFYNEKPVADVEVKICEKFSRFIGGCDGETFKTKTDANGEYLFSGIKPGVYEALLVRVFDSKAYVFAIKRFGISSAKYKFETDKTFFAPDTNLFKDDLKIQSPKSNTAVATENVEVKWDAYPDAAYYKLTLTSEDTNADSNIFNEKVESTSYKVPKNLKNGKYFARLEAYNANDKKLAETAKQVEFTVTGSEAN